MSSIAPERTGQIEFLPESGIRMLVEGFDYAIGLDVDLWDFSIEMKSLIRVGLNVNQLRWMLCKNLICHAYETTMPGDTKRTFHIQEHMALKKRSCFILTEDGASLLRCALKQEIKNASNKTIQTDSQQHRSSINGSHAALIEDVGSRGVDSPTWDCERQELRYREEIIKQFRLPCPNQAIVLSAFQEEGWPSRIDDPLPPRSEIDSKRRLHDTIKSLNRKQKTQLIRFRGDGTGEGVMWEMEIDS